MTDQNDHDLLIALNTKMEMMIVQQANFMSQVSEQTGTLRDRVTALENKDSRDSEKVQAIRADVQRSLNNGERITELATKASDLENEINRLRSKSNVFDIVNAIGFTVAGLIGYFFGR